MLHWKLKKSSFELGVVYHTGEVSEKPTWICGASLSSLCLSSWVDRVKGSQGKGLSSRENFPLAFKWKILTNFTSHSRRLSINTFAQLRPGSLLVSTTNQVTAHVGNLEIRDYVAA